MRRWVSSYDADPTMARDSRGTHVVETIQTTDWHGFSGVVSDAFVLQTPSGDIGGMILAGILLLVLGLTGVAVWQGRVSTIAGRLSGGVESGGRSHTDQRRAEAETATPPVEPEEKPEPEPTDQEVIVDILEGNEGRMKQAKIVDATGWSKSKVSMLLSEMEDDGSISKLRVGRENIISLQGNEPDAAGSPFEDE